MRVGIDISFLNTLKEKQGVHRYALGFIREITKDNKKRFQIYTNSKTYNESKKKFKNKNIDIILLENDYLILKKFQKLILVLLSFFGIFFYRFNSFFTNILNKKNKSIIEKNSDCIIFLNTNNDSVFVTFFVVLVLAVLFWLCHECFVFFLVRVCCLR